ncbi:hypothetical protein [Bdellovibrio reynosensis]|uniref:Uncharacterized protein n=1 Tax=Bdellovibrio reynosensis TaxID=2835041 RepID=A0ABY4CGC3_9BACT|nr:hypothetical protein [Bdellovibrio reynosensis]UOF02927.1 hypothetical protein MNR06_08190 [Bdellovibrio reynosensis]
MSSKTKSTHAELDHILNFVDASKGLRAKISESGRVQISQDLDGKVFSFITQDLSEILHRADSEGKPFIQVNFKNGTKVLLTENLVGFKPLETLGLDMARIPKVVTTPDLVSVFEAIEESLGSDAGGDQETEILKKVYMAIVSGGEKVGFDLSFERKWLNRLLASKFNASA